MDGFIKEAQDAFNTSRLVYVETVLAGTFARITKVEAGHLLWGNKKWRLRHIPKLKAIFLVLTNQFWSNPIWR